jgi:hypothetical protein
MEPPVKAHRTEGSNSASSSGAVTKSVQQSDLVWPALPLRQFTYFTERYFDQYVIRDVRGVPGHNLRLLRHSNGLLVLCLDPSHVLLQPSPSSGVVEAPVLTFDVKRGRGAPGETRDRREDTKNIKGKGKKQAPWVQPETVIVAIGRAQPPPSATQPTAEAVPAVAMDGAEGDAAAPAASGKASELREEYNKAYPYRVPACVNGSLLEVNGALSQDPSMLTRAPLTLGYIAVINPKVSEKFASFELVSKSLANMVEAEV